MNYSDIITFWFEELKAKQWWEKNNELDMLITTKFLEVHSKANKGELFSWRSNSKGRLAEIIVLDQFSRNMFRNRKEAFSSDNLALILAQEAVFTNSDKDLSNTEKSFLYMPFMHSESKVIHKEAVKLYSQEGLESNYKFELKHKVIIDEFNRYPHRMKY